MREVSGILGCSAATLRRWDREGLVSPRRSSGGYRKYTTLDLLRLQRVVYLRNVERLNPPAIRQLMARDGLLERSGDLGSAGGPSTKIPLRALRRIRNLTLQQAAAAAGLSTSFLSSAERGQSGISTEALTRLLESYGTSMSEVMQETTPWRDHRLTKAGRRRVVQNRDLGTTIELLAEGNVQMTVELATVEPGAGSHGRYSHEGEEFIYMLVGELDVWLVDATPYRLASGDCLYFPSTEPHSWKNMGSGSARMLWVNSAAPRAQVARPDVLHGDLPTA